ncbi:coproporphyrinogen III oxidase [Desulfosarcina widdelii]|uniref:Heme chaperone HemW n=1 Tax=Desulfosarcina widdelii TaxID=947919 RepID=A0A5K7Z312_9BACT|nr:radical SAM family heme chaperone HemW [Desulfosarcina widdelii]BBO74453.1 coproporphyrinogen III oxidase [Desulfosarcina widdelii]
MTAQPAGIYIHVPFCRAKCPYCDFYSVTALDRIDAFVKALPTEMDMQRHRISLADTVYFGGGTPSLLSARRIERILDEVHARFAVTKDAEVTLEVNPGTVGRLDLDAFRRAGVNRLNIGLQSTDDHILSFLGRIHSADTGIATYRHARDAGFDNVGLDLIYAVPGQTRKAWEAEMAKVVELAPEHLSCYTLTIEAGTPLARWVEEGRVRPLDENIAGDLFSATADFLEAHGYKQYEISNYARVCKTERLDLRSRHNRKYWNFVDYMGFGPNAHSLSGATRRWNCSTLDEYMDALQRGASPEAGRETLTREQQILEAVYLGLRQTEGIDTKLFSSRFQSDFNDLFGKQAAQLAAEGLIDASAEQVRLTRRGMRFMESVVQIMLE